MAKAADPRVQEIRALLRDLRDGRGGKPFSSHQIEKLTATLEGTLREIFRAGFQAGLGDGPHPRHPFRRPAPASRRPRARPRPPLGT
jgi:hypothetical protein